MLTLSSRCQVVLIDDELVLVRSAHNDNTHAIHFLPDDPWSLLNKADF